jgi:hypothetical protein
MKLTDEDLDQLLEIAAEQGYVLHWDEAEAIVTELREVRAEIQRLRHRVAELEAQPSHPDPRPGPVPELDPEEKARRIVRAGAPRREEGETEERFLARQDEYFRALRLVRGVGDIPAWLKGGPSAREAALAVAPRYRGDAEF